MRLGPSALGMLVLALTVATLTRTAAVADQICTNEQVATGTCQPDPPLPSPLPAGVTLAPALAPPATIVPGTTANEPGSTEDTDPATGSTGTSDPGTTD